jgi:hypothetical protein
LPPPQKGNGNRTARVRISSASDPQSELCVRAGALAPSMKPGLSSLKFV